MADFQEEVYIIEKKEITDDEEEDEEFEQIREEAEADQELGLSSPGESDASDDDLNDFNALKAKTEMKLAKKAAAIGSGLDGSPNGTFRAEAQPKVVERSVVIDDFIRNFLTSMKMEKTMNIFQQEWYELQKKGVFQDNGIGLITDISNKNAKMESKISKMREELKHAKTAAEQAKSTWEKLRKERDYHKNHQNRVNTEKVQITSNIKKIKGMHEDFEEKIEEVKKKLLVTVKEKALLKLEKDKLSNKAFSLTNEIKQNEEKVQQQIEAAHKRQRNSEGGHYPDNDGQMGLLGQSTLGKGVTKNTPYPEDARPNPYLSRQYDPFNARLSSNRRIDAHTKGIGGSALHMRKQIVATASDDCMWKIWNMETGENIMTGEGHREWISGIDFHPAGSHLATSGGDRSIKLWDFMSSSIAHTFNNVHTQPIWKVKFHDTGDFLLSAGGDGAMKLFDLHALKVRQQYRSHTDSVNSINFQPFTNFFVSGSADKTLSIWDMRTGLTVQTFYGHLNAINDTQFSIGGQYIGSADSDGIVKVWDIRMVQEVATVDTGDAIAHCCTFDKTGKFLAVGCSDAEIKMINVEKAEVVGQLKGHENSVNSLLFSHDNTTLYSMGGEGHIKIWK